MVLLAILGVLMGLLIPAVMKARDTANRNACKNNLRQIALALNNYASAQRRLPGILNGNQPRGSFGMTWMTQLLPYLGADDIYDQAGFRGASAAAPAAAGVHVTQLHGHRPAPAPARPAPAVRGNQATASAIKVLLCPSDGLGGFFSTAPNGSWSHSNYLGFVGVHTYGVEHQEGAFGSTYGRSLTEFRDGTSNTLLVGEYLTGVPQSEAPQDRRGVFWWDQAGSSQLFARVAPNSPVPDMLPIGNCYSAPERNLPCDVAFERDLDSATARSRHRGGVHVALADGGVRFINQNIDLKTWRSLVTVSAGDEPAEEADLGVQMAARRTPRQRAAAAKKQRQITLRDRYIVRFRDAGGISNAQLARWEKAGLKVLHRYNTRRVKGLAARIPPGLLPAVQRHAAVKAIHKDYLKFACAQIVPTGVRRIGADQSSLHPGKGHGPQTNATIAIMDTGIDEGHPDLNVTLTAGFGFPSGDDGNGHGTHVSGIAAAVDNDIGVVGVAPGARLWALRILDATGAGPVANEYAAVTFLINNFQGVDVVNMSFGGAGADATEEALIQELIEQGVIVVAAAGNDAVDIADGPFFPAAIGGVIAVAALADSDGQPGGLGPPLPDSDPITRATVSDPDDSFAPFSNFGLKVAYIAPGVHILSTLPGAKYGFLSGTSMASPHVTGVFALQASQRPQHDMQQSAGFRNIRFLPIPKQDDGESRKRIALTSMTGDVIFGPQDDAGRTSIPPQYTQPYPVINARAQ
jgi:type II secretory pathway pseudopilin PulG